MASRKRRGPEDRGMWLAQQVARWQPARRMGYEEKLEWRLRTLRDRLADEGITFREKFRDVLVDAGIREQNRSIAASYRRAYGPDRRERAPAAPRTRRREPTDADYPIVVRYSDGSTSRHPEARIAYDYAEPRIKFMGPGAWAEFYRADTGSYHPDTGSPFGALEVNEYGHVRHGGITRRGRASGDPRDPRRRRARARRDEGGYHVMTWGGDRYTAASWHADRASAEREVRRLRERGAWRGMPPKIERGRSFSGRDRRRSRGGR